MMTGVGVGLALFGLASSAMAALPDHRGYELISPVAKNGVTPYAAVPAVGGDAVDFQARGAFAGAASGALSLYQAHRGHDGWQTIALTPASPTRLGPLEEQAPVWFSSDLNETIFTTPASYAEADNDSGALDLYMQMPDRSTTWLSQGPRGASEEKEITLDSVTSDGQHVVFSTSASLVPSTPQLDALTEPEPEYVYERNVSTDHTSLLSSESDGEATGAVTTTLPNGYEPGIGYLLVARAEGFAPGESITIGSGPAAETTQISAVTRITGTTERLAVNFGIGLPNSYPPETIVTHASEGAILGDGGHLALGSPPAGEYLPADAGSGSTTNAISVDGEKVFLESPNPVGGEPVALFMRQANETTTKIAGGAWDGKQIAGLFGSEQDTFGSARYEGAASDGSLVFFESDEGLAGATPGAELYEFNTTDTAIGGVAPLTLQSISAGLGGDGSPSTTLTQGTSLFAETIQVASTERFAPGEMIAFGEFENIVHEHDSTLTAVIATIKNGTELTLRNPLPATGFGGVPAGTEIHGVHPASMTAVSNDGSHVYFFSDGVLASNANMEGAKAVAVKPNLYMFDTSTKETTFIGTVAENDVMTSTGAASGLAGEPDVSRPAVPSPDGGVLVFASAGNLTGQNPWQEYTEIYRYSVVGNSLECLSCTAPGVKPTGDASFGETAGGTYDPPGLTSPMSEDGGRVFFQTPDSLVPEDTNGDAPLSAKFGTPTSTDVYEWEAGRVSLISSGSGSTPAVLQGTTPSGDDVLFTSTAQLVPGQSDGGYENVFDARVGGGFPEAAHAAPSCVGSGCRAAFGVAPVFAAPASASPQGRGNSGGVAGAKAKAKPRPVACRRGFVRRRVRGRVVCARKARKGGGTARGARVGRVVGVRVGRSR